MCYGVTLTQCVTKIFVAMTSKNQLETFKCKFFRITNFKQVDFHSLL